MHILTDDACMEIARHLGTIELSCLIRVSKEMARLVNDFLFVMHAPSLTTFMNLIICKRQPSRNMLLRFSAPSYLTNMNNMNQHFRYSCSVCGGRTADVASCVVCKTL